MSAQPQFVTREMIENEEKETCKEYENCKLSVKQIEPENKKMKIKNVF